MNAPSDIQTSPFLTVMELLASLHPPRTLLHVGAGAAGDAALYEAVSPDNMVLVEAQAELFNRLSQRYRGEETVYTLQAVAAATNDEALFHVSSLIAESGLLPSDDMAPFWKNIVDIDSQKTSTTTLDALIEDAAVFREPIASPNWLIVDCLPSLDILNGAQAALHDSIEVVAARVILKKKEDARDAWKRCLADDVSAFMESVGFTRVSCRERRHPELGVCLFVKDWKRSAASEKTLAKQLSLAKQDLDALREDYRALAERNERLDALLAEMRREIEAIVGGASKGEPSKPAATRRKSSPRKSSKGEIRGE